MTIISKFQLPSFLLMLLARVADLFFIRLEQIKGVAIELTQYAMKLPTE